jgi:hypothetical protein
MKNIVRTFVTIILTWLALMGYGGYLLKVAQNEEKKDKENRKNISNHFVTALKLQFGRALETNPQTMTTVEKDRELETQTRYLNELYRQI